MPQYEFTFPHLGTRVFTLNSEPSPALVRLVQEHSKTLMQRNGGDGEEAETDDEYGTRLYLWFTGDSERFNGIVRMSLAGDHSGIDWYTTGDVLMLLDAVLGYFQAMFPKALKLAAQLEERKQRAEAERSEARAASIAEAKQRMQALAERTPMATCGLCDKPVKKWAHTPTGVAVGFDCGCAKNIMMAGAAESAPPPEPPAAE